MAKEKTVYVCSNCGQESPKWQGKCPACGQWNTFVEEIVRKEPTNKRPVSGIETVKSKPVTLDEIEAADEPRIDLHDAELNRVLGGGLVQGSLVLIGGEPGIGKSTLVLQTVLRMPEKRILYISGEESARQLKLRAERLTKQSSDCLIVCETSLEQIYVHIKNTRPDLVIIDSIQTISTETLESSPHLEILRKENYDVLFMTDPIAEWVISEIGTYDGKKLKSVNKGDVKFDESIQKELEEKTKKAADENKPLVELIKKTLGTKVKDVRFSSRLTESACCLVSDEYDPSAYMQRVLKAMDRNAPNVPRILELNPDHPLVVAMKKLHEKAPDNARLSEFSEMLYDQALLAEGSPIPDPLLFTKRTAALMTLGVEKEASAD